VLDNRGVCLQQQQPWHSLYVDSALVPHAFLDSLELVGMSDWFEPRNLIWCTQSTFDSFYWGCGCGMCFTITYISDINNNK
jgi:hypothetical protein